MRRLRKWAVLVIFLAALSSEFSQQEAYAVCRCEELYEWSGYSGIAFDCATAAHNAAQAALADFRIRCQPNRQQLSTLF